MKPAGAREARATSPSSDGLTMSSVPSFTQLNNARGSSFIRLIRERTLPSAPLTMPQGQAIGLTCTGAYAV
jgi:hypothetical protein